MEPLKNSSVDEFASVEVTELMSDPLDIEFDIEAATETILPYVSFTQAGTMDNEKTIAPHSSGARAPGRSMSSSETSAIPQTFSGQDLSSKSSPGDAALSLISLGLEEPLPSQEVQDDL